MAGLRRSSFFITFALLIFPAMVSAEGLDFELDASSDYFEAKVTWSAPIYDQDDRFGAGFIYADDFKIANASVAVTDDRLVRALTLGLGFKGVIGEIEHGRDDFDLMAFGFHGLGEYDFRKTSSNLPLVLWASATWAPDPLAFSDSTEYLEFSTGIYFYFVRNAAIALGYWYLESEFDENHGSIDESEDVFFLGLKVSF